MLLKKKNSKENKKEKTLALQNREHLHNLRRLFTSPYLSFAVPAQSNRLSGQQTDMCVCVSLSCFLPESSILFASRGMDSFSTLCGKQYVERVRGGSIRFRHRSAKQTNT